MAPHRPLLPPVQFHGDLPNSHLLNLLTPYGRPRQEQEFLLDIGGQIQEREDLSHSGRGDLSVAGEVGLVGD